MARKRENTRPADLDVQIAAKLDEAYNMAEEFFISKKKVYLPMRLH